MDCVLRGGNGAWLDEKSYQSQATAGGAGLDLANSKVVVISSDLTGGTGGTGGTITDTDGSPAGRGGDGLLNRLSGAVEVHGGRLQGGNGGSADCEAFGGFCGPGGGGDGVRQQNPTSSVAVRGVDFAPASAAATATARAPGPRASCSTCRLAVRSRTPAHAETCPPTPRCARATTWCWI